MQLCSPFLTYLIYKIYFEGFKRPILTNKLAALRQIFKPPPATDQAFIVDAPAASLSPARMSVTFQAQQKQMTRRETLEHEMKQTAFAGRHFQNMSTLHAASAARWRKISAVLALALCVCIGRLVWLAWLAK